MCDCYMHPCEFCGRKISLHIADYCTDRENIKVFCSKCAEKAKTFNKVINAPIIINETIECNDEENYGGKIGEVVLIVCYDKDAYGIHLN